MSDLNICNQKRELIPATFNIPWKSEEESIRKSCENLKLIRDTDRCRSCSPNIGLTSEEKTSSTPTNADKPKIQVGMDKYITTTKRQRSPKSGLSQPNKKIAKGNDTATTSNQNRFSILETDEPTVTVTKKSFKPPPIYLRKSTSNELIKNINAVIGDNFYVTTIKQGNIKETKIQVKNEDEYRKLTNHLEKEKLHFYTYQLKSAKGLQVVIKGIDSCVDPEDVKVGLSDNGFKIKNVINIRNREKIPQPMFKVELQPGDIVLKKNETHPIYDLKYLLYRKITVEEPHKRLGPVQCLNCQEFGHTKTYCKLPSVCVVCGELHGTSQCKKSKSDSNAKKCSNCGGNHTANFRGCPVYAHFKRSMTKPPTVLPNTTHQPEYSASNNIPISNNIPANKIPQIDRHYIVSNPQQVTYANMVKSKMPNLYQENKSQFPDAPIPNIEATLQLLVQSINTFTDSITTMMQEMLKMQTAILQAILKK